MGRVQVNKNRIIRLLKSIAKRTISEHECKPADVEVLIQCERNALIIKKDNGSYAITREGKAFLRRASCEVGDPYREQHVERVNVRDSVGQSFTVNAHESPLARLYYHRSGANVRIIKQHQYEAGERLRSDFERARISPKTGLNLAPKVDGGGAGNGAAHALDASMAARRRLARALHFVGGELGSVLLDVCCFLKGLELVEREREWPNRSAKVVLRLALERLAEHYGLQKEAAGRERDHKRAYEVWSAEDSA